MSRAVNLDALRAATQGDPIDVTVGGATWRVLPTFPYDAALAWQRGQFREAFELLPVDPSDGAKFADAVMGDRLSAKEYGQTLDAIYEQDTGES